MNVESPISPASGRSGRDLATELRIRVSPEAVVRRDEPLARRTTLRVGGPADAYIEPASEADLQSAIEFCAEQHVPFFVLGRGSNLLVRDGGFRGVVFSLTQRCFSFIEVTPPQFRCGAGARLKDLAVAAKRSGVAGLEFLEGIPGSVGGGLRMNAGAMGGAMFDVVQTVRMMDFQGAIVERRASELEVKYRGCASLKSQIALSAVLQGHSGGREEIERKMKEFSQKRWSSQPAAPSAGCMFKNPVAIPAGKLIDELGLKGTRVGGAMISFEHGNFLVTDGSATARDVLELIKLVQAKAQAARGIDLQTEVEIIGE